MCQPSLIDFAWGLYCFCYYLSVVALSVDVGESYATDCRDATGSVGIGQANEAAPGKARL
jgi:hypothetical protein